MGGQLIKGYSIQGDALCSTGIVHSWKLYKAQKSSTQSSASIFLIEKKQLKKQDKDEVIRISKKQSTNLLRVRHPGVLAVVESLVEDENVLAFVSQKVEGNLSLLLKQNKMQEFIASELELKLFLYPFIETLEFLHNTLKQAHLGISLDSIYVTSDGKWKLGGFGVNQVMASEEGVPFSEKVLDLSCSAPELVVDKIVSKRCDIFSVGMYIHKCYKPSEPVKNPNEYDRNINQIKNITAHPVIAKTNNPQQLTSFLRGMLSWNSQERTHLSGVLSSQWMNDSTLITVKYLDKITNYEPKQQLQFLKGIAGVLDDFPSRVLIRILIPKLLDLIKYNNLIASIVYIIIDLLKKKKIDEPPFKKLIWPTLKNVTQAKQTTAQAIYLFVANLDIFETFVGEPDMSTHIMPLYLKCYDCPAKLKQLALSMVEKISKKVDYQFLKTKLLPKLLGLFKDPNIEIRKDALKALFGILPVIDTQTVSLTILPGLQAVRKAGSDAFVNAIIGRMYKMLGESLQIDIISSKILPTLIPYLTDPSISKTQFSQWKTLIFQMIERIEREAVKNLEGNNALVPTYTDADFKMKEIDLKTNTQEKKGNYSFLSNYAEQKKEQSTTDSLPLSNPAATVSQPPTFPQNPQQLPQISQPSFPPKVQNPPLNALNTMSFQPQPKVNIQTSNQPSLSIPDNFFTSSQPVSMTPVSATNSVSKSQNEFNIEAPKKQNNTYNEASYLADLPAFQFGSAPTPTTQKASNSDNMFNLDSNFGKTEPPKIKPIKAPKPQEVKGTETKIMGGASGPLQVKKFVGPNKVDSPRKDKPLEKNPNLNWNYEQNSKESNIFAMNINESINYGSISSSNAPKFTGMMSAASSSAQENPFADIETNNKPQQAGQSSDIYSYFESEDPKLQENKAKNSFDLI